MVKWWGDRPFWFKVAIIVVLLILILPIIYFNFFPGGKLIIQSDKWYDRATSSSDGKYALIATEIRSDLIMSRLVNLKTGDSVLIEHSTGEGRFSPNSDKILYPEGDNLYVYDIPSSKSLLVTQKVTYQTNNYYSHVYAWLDENNIIYRCTALGNSFVAKRFISGEEEFVNSTYCKLNLNDFDLVTGYSQPEGNFTDYLPDWAIITYGDPCSSDRTLCAYRSCFMSSFPEGCAINQIHVKKGNANYLVQRGGGSRNLFWTGDNHLYGLSENSLIKFY
ncbi:MAG: hypothetical protein A2256_03015 [Candidatus Staskawiczbacteria bacterium RIFOXYA2_FULL_32_7]|nr:MAG: hypothetical protein A2256_03015 [Candidatus Staskawiczbacteria bacterium RIFOXYA2_FULL_32_7]